MLLEQGNSLDFLTSVRQLSTEQYESINEQIDKINGTLEEHSYLCDIIQKKMLYVLRKRDLKMKEKKKEENDLIQKMTGAKRD